MIESDKSGKPELTAPNRARYEVYMQLAGEDSRVVWDNRYQRKLKPKEVVKLLNTGDAAAQARIAELETLISDMFDWCKCGYVHNSRMPVDRGLTILAKAKSIRDKKEVTPQDIRDWIH